jgi:hypothetical protein
MEINKATNMKEDELFLPRFLIIGDSGSGKTTALKTWPGKLFGFDFWGNKESYEGAPNIDFVTYSHFDPRDPATYVQWYRDMGETRDLITHKQFPYSALFIDTLTGIGDLMLNYCLSLDKASGDSMAKGPGGAPTEAHFRALGHIMHIFIEDLVSLRIPVILNCHSEPVSDKSSLQRAVVWGKRSRSTIYTYFSEVYRSFGAPTDKLDSRGEPLTEWFWQTQPEPDWPMLKSIMSTGGSLWGRFVDPNYSTLLERRGIKL